MSDGPSDAHIRLEEIGLYLWRVEQPPLRWIVAHRPEVNLQRWWDACARESPMLDVLVWLENAGMATLGEGELDATRCETACMNYPCPACAGLLRALCPVLPAFADLMAALQRARLAR